MTLKEQVLAELEKHRGTDLSGQALAERFGVSRNAIWKAVNALREDGHKILSGLNRGYRLSESDDKLSLAGIELFLRPETSPLATRVFHTLDSTNAEAHRLLARGENCPLLVLSEEQTAGRGRQGREFYSPEGTGLYMTLAVQPRMEFSQAALLTTAAAVAVVQAIESLTDRHPAIKWVNDIFLDGKKLGGILTEATGDFETGRVDSALIGIGLNVRTEAFPDPLRGAATSLQLPGLSRNRLAAEIVNRLLSIVARLPERAFLDFYRARCLALGREIEFVREGNVFRAFAESIDDAGGLCLRYADGSRETLRAGEIHLRI